MKKIKRNFYSSQLRVDFLSENEILALLCPRSSSIWCSDLTESIKFYDFVWLCKKSYTKISWSPLLEHNVKIRYPQSTLIRAANLQHDEKIFNDGWKKWGFHSFIHLLNITEMGLMIIPYIHYALLMPPKHFIVNPLQRYFIHLTKQFFRLLFTS